MSPQQQRWVEDYCDGTIGSEEFLAFEEALLADAEFRAATRSYLAMDSHLRQGEEDIRPIVGAWSKEAMNGQTPTGASSGSGSLRPWLVAAVAGMALLVALAISFFDRDEPRTAIALADDGIGVLSDSVDAVWEGSEVPVQGGILSAGEFSLASGLVQIEFYSGAHVLVEGPANFSLVSIGQIDCDHGKLRVHVPPHALGFQVGTPVFTAVDLGTDFGVEVAPDGEASLHVFEGKVEVAPRSGPAGGKWTIEGGSGLVWQGGGSSAPTPRAAAPGDFPSLHGLREQSTAVARERQRSLQARNEQLRADPGLILHYDFQDKATSSLRDAGPSGLHGTIVGAERTAGRWPGNRALEFERPGDRVRIDVPGQFDALTLMFWLRPGAIPNRYQHLLHPDDYHAGRPSWSISPDGGLMMGFPSGARRPAAFISTPVLTPERTGTWILVVSTYDRLAGSATFNVDGEEIFRQPLVDAPPIGIGRAGIGNWGVAPELLPQILSREIRNFVGEIDEILVWGRALTPDEIREFYLATRP